MLSRAVPPAALAALLALTGCAAGEPAPGSTTGSAETTDASADAPEHAAPAGGDGGASTEATTEAAGSAPSGSAPADSAESPEAEALRQAATSQLDRGEPGVAQHSGASLDDVLRLGAVASWVEEPEVFAISLPAGSECWASADAPLVAADDRLVVAFVEDKSCEPVSAARTYTLRVPDGVDAGSGLELAIVGLEHDFTLALPPA